MIAVAPAAASNGSKAVDRTLTVTVTGKGTVKSTPSRIACPTKCQAKFASGAVVALRATAAAGWKFSRWTGACTGTKVRCTITLKTSKRAGAVFTRVPKPPPPPPPAGFTPQTLAGNWQGTWRNTRFGSTGSAAVVVSVIDASSFSFSLNLGGNIFGCPTPPPVAAVITAGEGANHWNRDGFSLQITGPQGGSINATYVFATQTLTGNGRPGCRPGLTWALQGTFSGNTFNGTMTNTLEDGSTAPAVVTLTRS